MLFDRGYLGWEVSSPKGPPLFDTNTPYGIVSAPKKAGFSSLPPFTSAGKICYGLE